MSLVAFVSRERRSDLGGVAHEQVLLQATSLCRFDERRGEIAEAGRHPIDDRTLVDERLDDLTRLLHPRSGAVVEADRDVTARDGFDLGDGEVGPRQDDFTPRRTWSRRPSAALGDLRLGHGAEDSRLCSPPCSTS